MTVVRVDNTPIMLQSLHSKAVIRLKPSGYLTKESTNTQIPKKLQCLRYPVV